MQHTPQQPSLKALAAQVLARTERNTPCNTRATEAQKPCNNTPPERLPFVASENRPATPSPDGLRTWWWIYRDGRPLCQMVMLGGLTREEALRSARARWPDHSIEVPELDLDGRVIQNNSNGDTPCP